MTRCALPLMLAAGLAARLSPAQSFEVATVKLNAAGPAAPNGFSPSPGRLRVTNSTLEQMILAAFHVKSGTLAGIRGWMTSDRFDVEAKPESGANFDDELAMLRALLIERFRLRYHTETRQLTTLALMAAKGGAKLRAAEDGAGAKERITIRPGEISGVNIPFGHFVTVLGAQLKQAVTNETGLAGNFDLALKYSPDDAGNGPAVYAALEEQLGLRLEARKGPVEVMVIDAAEKPRL